MTDQHQDDHSLLCNPPPWFLQPSNKFCEADWHLPVKNSTWRLLSDLCLVSLLSVRIWSRSAPWSSISMVMILPMLSPWPAPLLMKVLLFMLIFSGWWLVELITGEQTSSICRKWSIRKFYKLVQQFCYFCTCEEVQTCNQTVVKDYCFLQVMTSSRSGQSLEFIKITVDCTAALSDCLGLLLTITMHAESD